MALKKHLQTAFFAATLLLAASSAHTAENRGATSARLYSIEVRESEISDVLRALAQQSGLNIVLGEGVAGKTSLSFKDVPFKDALEMVIRANGLMYTMQNNVLWVGKKVDMSGEMTVEIITLNNADPASVATQIKGDLSPDGTSTPDIRTNSLVIRDLPRNIEKARKTIKAIDVQTSQVVIEARIVEANSNYSRALGIQWGGRYVSGKDVITGSQLLPASSGGRNFAVNLPAASATSGIGMVLGNLTSKILLDIELSAAETRGELKIISRPKISTMNNKPATIHSGLTFRVKLAQSVVSGGGASTTTTSSGGLEEIKTGIDLSVTPQISPNGFVMLKIDTNKSDPDFSRTVDGIPGVAEKSASTNVLVKDGETVVIGGLYRSITTEQENAVPYFSKIPLLGALFKSKSKSMDNEELLVFITPQIVKIATENAH
ncbi:MAG: type IV pilus secretin PilQ [Deltaproteobacteria bacterium]